MNFFAILMRELDKKLFEGNRSRCLPKKDSNLQRMFETAGVIMAHSVLQGGPGFPCLCPAALSYIIHLDKERALEQLPTVNDIPRNAATVGLLSLIEEDACVLCMLCMYIMCVCMRLCVCVCVCFCMCICLETNGQCAVFAR